MKIPFLTTKEFHPNFPIIPLFATEEDAVLLLSRHGTVSEEDPESDKTIAQKLLVAESKETRITVGIWSGRVRFTNYLTDLFNSTDDLKGRKLGWFVKYYGGKKEFSEPNNTGYILYASEI